MLIYVLAISTDEMKSITVPLRDTQTIKCTLISMTRSQGIGAFSPKHLENRSSSTCFAFVIHIVISDLYS